MPTQPTETQPRAAGEAAQKSRKPRDIIVRYRLSDHDKKLLRRYAAVVGHRGIRAVLQSSGWDGLSKAQDWGLEEDRRRAQAKGGAS